MKCQFCDYPESSVDHTYKVDISGTVERRRECLGCGRRFTTYEIYKRDYVALEQGKDANARKDCTM